MGVTANGAQFLCLMWQKNIRYFPINKDLWIFLLSLSSLDARRSVVVFVPPPLPPLPKDWNQEIKL